MTLITLFSHVLKMNSDDLLLLMGKQWKQLESTWLHIELQKPAQNKQFNNNIVLYSKIHYA